MLKKQVTEAEEGSLELGRRKAKVTCLGGRKRERKRGRKDTGVLSKKNSCFSDLC